MKEKKKIIYVSLSLLLVFVLTTMGVIALKRKAESLLKQQDVKTQLLRQKNKKKIVKSKKIDKDNTENDTLIFGTILDTKGQPIKDVVVSDGFTCQKTDVKGQYKLKRDKKAHFVFYTVPENCEIPVHSKTNNTAYFYKRITKDSVYNFTLTKLKNGKETNYKMFVIGDPQITNSNDDVFVDASDNSMSVSDLERFTRETMVDINKSINKLPQDMPVYGLSMGDNVQFYGGYNSELQKQMCKALGSSRMKVFSIIGNHDQDGKELYKRNWEDTWGPTDYSFNRGNEHYVCLNNVDFFNGEAYYQPGELSNAQMKWLQQDLSFVDKSKKIILCYHVPLTLGTRPNKYAKALNSHNEEGHYTSSRLGAILNMLQQFKGGYELFCGHTHFALNHEINYNGINVMERCHAAACGLIWQSNINICGTPNGYYIYSFNETALEKSYYKGTFWNKNKQMSLFRVNTNFNEENYAVDWNLPKEKNILVVNVFNANSKWEIVAIEDGKEHKMNRIISKGQDAFAVGYHRKYSKSVPYSFIGKQNGYLIMNHLYYYEPQSTESHIVVRVKDEYGNIYVASSSEVITHPFFNYAHYYNYVNMQSRE